MLNLKFVSVTPIEQAALAQARKRKAVSFITASSQRHVIDAP
jgi:hypothetical protein